MTNDLISLCNATSIKTLNEEVQRTSGLANTWRCQEGGASGEGTGAPRPSHTFPVHLHLQFPSRILYNEPVNTDKVFP